ncbi:outer membrane protein [Phreatobacter stygius]|uniref:Porin family protein n=1 Tax=Phreatobacter stygius TaxID=1940610 RepID=A0A4D7AWL1_9HYPH|nr:outer membrane beta-barrel protein [Phreatobacter stygius]QCI65509.1 porin family protein [Phreatobacter stygius]
MNGVFDIGGAKPILRGGRVMARRMRIAAGLTALAALLAVAGGAQAADMALRGSLPSYEASTPGWGGLYGGIHGGIGSANFDGTGAARSDATRRLAGLVFLGSNSLPSAPDMIQIGAIRSTPTIFGLFVGYQAQYEDAVIGVEFDYNRIGGSAGGTRSWTQPYSVMYSSTGFTDAFSQGATVTARLQDYVTLRMRAGWAYGRLMPYITAGAVLARGSTSVTYTAGYERIDTDAADGANWTQPFSLITPAAPLNTTSSSNATGFGFAAGAGLEALVTDNIFVRGEYQFIRVPSLGGVPVTLQTVRAGVGIKY